MVLVMPAGRSDCEGGRIEQVTVSDCGQYAVLTVRADAPARSEQAIRILPEAD
ncbi:MAG: hypothetical protein ACLFU7_13125 [Armatimonadota bacterium]